MFALQNPFDRLTTPAFDRWPIALTLAGATAFTLWIIRSVLARRFRHLAQRTPNKIDDLAVELIARTRWYFIAVLSLRAGAAILDLSADTRETVGRATAVMVLLQLAIWGGALIDFWLRQWVARRGDAGGGSTATIDAIGMLARGALWSLIAVLALSNVLGYDITALITGLGIGGVAIALAVQNVLGDIFAALSIVLDKPFEIGDTIAIDTTTGTVEQVGLKTTRVRSVTGEQVIIANGDLLKSRVRNMKRMTERQALFTVRVPYDTPVAIIEQVSGILRGVVDAVPMARFDRAHLARLAESWLEFEVVYFVRSPDFKAYMDTQEAVNLGTLRALAQAGVQVAFPTRVVRQVGEAA
jgi:small-conductance mechanosensitive channel